jgi:Fe-S cluster biogenesis protein NfuA
MVEAVEVREAVTADAPVTADTPESAGLPPLTREQIEVLFEDMVRPALQSDGGDIRLINVESNDVYVELVGACQTCPSSIVTMQMGIERLLQEEFPQFGRLIRVNEQA